MKLAVLFIFISLPVLAENWDSDNDPRIFDSNYEYRLNALPLKAVLPLNKTPWASSFWPRKKGGINYRWNTVNPTGYIVQPSRGTVKAMSKEAIATLSPAEKFDLVQGHYDYPLSSRVLANANPKAKDFEGICDGWTASAIQFSEPSPVEVTNPDGIVIPFGTSDVKALMSYDVSINFEPGALRPTFVGGYCSTPWGMRLGLNNCRDINPGAFHVILANQIALKKEAFGVDIDPGKETWNQPVYGFEYEIRGMTTADHAARAYVVHAKLMYAEDDPDAPNEKKVFTWTPTVGTADYMGSVMELDYILEVDGAGRISGGSWIDKSKGNHPDLFWMPTAKIEFTHEFRDVLKQIYKPSFE
jgi:hypothetical protein